VLLVAAVAALLAGIYLSVSRRFGPQVGAAAPDAGRAGGASTSS
jgi:hypothetical protein